MSTRSSRSLWVVAAVLLIATRAALAFLIWEPGYSALTWDDFSRVEISQGWAHNPYVIADLVWLPLPTWINGLSFALFGDSFTTNPMALTAIVNTSAVIITALVSAWAAWLIFKSRSGALLVLTVILFAPWGVFLGGSGLAEPLYYLAVAVAALSAVAWIKTGRLWALSVGSVAIAAATAMRYEGWWLAASWFGLAVIDTLRARGDLGRVRSLVHAWPRIAVAASPFLVPAGWMAVNYARTGSPLYFAQQSAEIFLSAYGTDLFRNIVGRFTYYPFGLIKAAPLLLAAVIAVVLARRSMPEVRGLMRLFGLAFTLFYLTSVVSPAVGGFPERFLFAFVLGAAPILGGLPGVIREWTPRSRTVLVGVSLALLAVTFTVVRISNPPEEWTHAPDLLLLTEALGDVGLTSVALGPSMPEDAVPIDTRNGADTEVVSNDDPRLDIQIERSPARVVELDELYASSVGRYHLYGPEADEVEVAVCPGCDGWVWVDEMGTERPISGRGFLWLEFITNDPLSGQTTSITRRIAGGSSGHLDLRWLYGHGFNSGRMRVDVSLDGDILFTTDISAPSAWTRVPFELPSGSDDVTVSVSVTALPGIEQGWLWGRASTVLVREMTVEQR